MTPEAAAAECYTIYELYLRSGQIGACGVSCADVLNCITTDSATRDAVIALLIETGALGSGAGGANYGLMSLYTSPLGSVPGCDEDDRYGVAYNVVDMLNTVMEDLLDIVELILTQAEMAVALIAWVPLLGAFVESARKVALYVIEQVSPVYRAAFNTTTHQQIACEIYCRIPSDGCTVTLEALISAYEEILGDFAPPGAFVGIVETAEWFASLVLDTDLLWVAAAHLLVLSVFVRGGAFMSVSRTVLTIAIETAIPITVPCDPCPEICEQWLAGGLPYSDWTIVPYSGYSGTYNGAEDRFEGAWDHVHGSGKFIQISRDFTGQDINSIKVTWSCSNTRSTSGLMIVRDDETVLYSNNGYPPNGTGTQSLTFDPPHTMTGDMVILLGCRTWDDDAAAHIYITKIEVCHAAA